MATRSAIGVAYGDVIKAVYCHWDGYPENNGRILVENYDRPRASELLTHGDISSLRPEIGIKHAFSSLDQTTMSSKEFDQLYGNMSTFYHRDRGEDLNEWRVFDTAEAMIEHFEGNGCEYFYILGNDGVWYVADDNSRQWKKVKDVLVELNSMEDA
jgi:hypothetical protein